MKTHLFFTAEPASQQDLKHWWLFALLGLLSVAFGIWLFFVPVEGYAALTFIFSAGFFIWGGISLFFTIANRHLIPAWGWNLAFGLVLVILGLILLANPVFTADLLAFYVAFALLFSSINLIVTAFSFRHLEDHGWGWTLALGILVMLFSIFLMLHPLFTAFTLVIWSALGFLTLGLSFFDLAYHCSKAAALFKRRQHAQD